MISVCLASFNGEKFIATQLQSVLSQLGPCDEVVVADDGSTDNTLAVIAGLGDARVRIIVNGGALGVVGNFERALNDAKGDTVYLCDQDDVWLPGKIARCEYELTRNVLVLTDCTVVDERLSCLKLSYFQALNSGSGILRNIYKNSYIGCCMAMRREVLSFALPFPKKIAMHDWWIGLVAECVGPVLFLDEVFTLHRRHADNASHTGQVSRVPIFKRLCWRVYILRKLVQRFAGVVF